MGMALAVWLMALCPNPEVTYAEKLAAPHAVSDSVRVLSQKEWFIVHSDGTIETWRCRE